MLNRTTSIEELPDVALVDILSRLPPPSRVFCDVPVGFICDPYYNFHKEQEEDNIGDAHHHHHRRKRRKRNYCSNNVAYRCKVVRMVPYDDDDDDTSLPYGGESRFKLEIFSLEVGEWRESTTSFPREFHLNVIDYSVHYAHNGMLYWKSGGGGIGDFLIGLDPFMISCDTTSKCYQGHYVELVPEDLESVVTEDYSEFHMQCLGGQVCLQICTLDYSSSRLLVVWQLKDLGDLIIEPDGVRKLCPRKDDQLDFAREVEMIGFDPNKEGYLYVRFNAAGRVANINLRTESELTYEMIDLRNGGGEINMASSDYFFPMQAKPWWPTPVPRLSPTNQTTSILARG